MKRTSFAIFLVVFLKAFALPADVKLASPFTSHMVLQREMRIPIWGTAESGEAVTVAFAGQKQTATADAEGKWHVTLQALPASSQGRIFTVTGSRMAQPIALEDVLVGEVWLASGQSNMTFPISSNSPGGYYAGIANEKQEIAAANYPLLRMFTGKSTKSYEPRSTVSGEWVVCSPATVPDFSAVGYIFARDLQRELRVPVGILTEAYGASTAEAWIQRETLAADPQLKPLLDSFDAAYAKYQEFISNPTNVAQLEEQKKKYEAAAAQPRAAGARPPRAPADPDPSQNQHNPTVLFNGMINPIVPYAIRGVIWYQGESIVGGAQGIALYPRVQAALIGDWRELWGEGEFPFYIVQLAGQEAASNSPQVREAQASVLKLHHTGMAVATDIGEAHNVHPKDKEDVGDRLCRIALANTYGRGIEYSGPRYDSMKVAGSAIRIKFTHLGSGLVAKGGPLKWFVIAGADMKFVPADARIDGDTLVVSSPQVSAPVAVRYAWVNFPDGCNLFNAAGLPAAQFRTDANVSAP